MSGRGAWAAAALALVAAAGGAAPEPPAGLAENLRPAHPRLWLTDERLTELQRAAVTDPTLAGWAARVVESARRLTGARPPPYQLSSSRGLLLEISRRHLDAIATLAFAWRWTNEAAFEAAARRFLLNACEFPDWHPDHFLDTAEMTCAVALGYDWLYGALDRDTRRRIEEALIRHGLEPGRRAYAGEARYGWWTRVSHNWNLVCNGGLLAGALAIGDVHPLWLNTIVRSAVTSMPRALASYAPDGGWGEGPSYWNYATTYVALGLDALRTALGTDFGLSRSPGLSSAAVVPLPWVGPTGLYFNFADASERARRRPAGCVMWLARAFNDRAAAADEHAQIAAGGAPSPWHVVWYVPAPRQRAPRPLDLCVRGEIPVVTMGGNLGDSNALWVAVKAGHNRINHGHLDLGTFVLDALGRRWVLDLGKDSYSLPGYFGRNRWRYFRNGSESHAVPLIRGRGQSPEGVSTVERFDSTPEAAAVVLDLTRAYGPPVRRFRRGVALVAARRAVTVRDELELEEAAEVRWGFVTGAEIRTDGDRRVTLRAGGAEVVLRALGPETASWRVSSAERPSPEERNRGLVRLDLVCAPAAAHRIVVVFAPVWPDGARDDAVAPPLDGGPLLLSNGEAR
ncbi:MAG: heparinase II/III-family protein [Kiritimatiellae bacterium]|nr:heparinase II/III-family protein [Kiritimatiellia bacterium]